MGGPQIDQSSHEEAKPRLALPFALDPPQASIHPVNHISFSTASLLLFPSRHPEFPLASPIPDNGDEVYYDAPSDLASDDYAFPLHSAGWHAADESETLPLSLVSEDDDETYYDALEDDVSNEPAPTTHTTSENYLPIVVKAASGDNQFEGASKSKSVKKCVFIGDINPPGMKPSVAELTQLGKSLEERYGYLPENVVFVTDKFLYQSNSRAEVPVLQRVIVPEIKGQLVDAYPAYVVKVFEWLAEGAGVGDQLMVVLSGGIEESLWNDLGLQFPGDRTIKDDLIERLTCKLPAGCQLSIMWDACSSTKMFGFRSQNDAQVPMKYPRLSVGSKEFFESQHSALEETTPRSLEHRPLRQPEFQTPLSRNMSMAEIITRLRDHHCHDLTDGMDLASSSEFPISNGGFGDVYRLRLRNGTQVAVKTIRIQIGLPDEESKHLVDAARELHTWTKCDHPNVLKLQGLIAFRGQIGMVSMWMEHGNLPTYISRRPEQNRCHLSKYVSEGLAYLHHSNIVHGDLKGANVLVSEDGTPMLTDFGNAKLRNRSLLFTSDRKITSISLRWASPELFEGTGEHTMEADIYALGMTILEAITGNVPYFGKNEFATMYAIVEHKLPSRPSTISPETEGGNRLWALLKDCWSPDPKSRPSAEKVMDIMKRTTVEEISC